jgi:hypothetical protein
MTKRECDVAAEQGARYRVRRVFHFRNKLRMFDIAPPLAAQWLKASLVSERWPKAGADFRLGQVPR